MTYEALKFLHVLGAIVLLGTGSGIAFFMFMAHRSNDRHFIAMTAATVVIADTVFTAGAVVIQPITGYLLVQTTGQTLSEFWIAAAIALYLVAGLFWLPVVWMQIRMRDLAVAAVRDNLPLPDAYHRLFRVWVAFGFPGFGAVLAIIWLMIAKPGW